MTEDRTITTRLQVVAILEDVLNREMTIEEAERRLNVWCEQHAARTVEFDRGVRTVEYEQILGS